MESQEPEQEESKRFIKEIFKKEEEEVKRKPRPQQFPGKWLKSHLWIKRITVQSKNDRKGRISAKINVSQESGEEAARHN